MTSFDPATHSPLAVVLRFVVIAYRMALSPVLGPNCRYEPTCSSYALQAIERFGALRGGWLACRRIARCHPWGGCGHDPVPEAFAGGTATAEKP